MSATEAQALRASIEALEKKESSHGTKIMFHGLPHENYAEFKLAAELETMLEDDDKKKTRLLLSMLGIKPKSIIAVNKPPRGTSLDEEWIWTHLDATYGDSARAERATDELEGLRYKGGPLPEFNHLFDMLCSQAGVTGELQARMYRNKMTVGIKDRLLVSRATTLKEMKEQASLFAPAAERDFKRQQAQKPRKPEVKGRATRLDERDLECWNCSKKGHISTHCPEPKKKEGRPKRGYQGRRPREDTVMLERNHAQESENLEGLDDATDDQSRFEEL